MSNQLKLQVVFGAIDRLSAPFKSINDRIDRHKNLIRNSNAHLKKMQASVAGVQQQQQALQAKGIKVSNTLMNAEKSLQAEIVRTSATIAKNQQTLAKLGKTAERNRRLSARAESFSQKGQSITTSFTAPVGIGLGLAVKEAIEVEKAMAGVAKFAPEFDGNTQKQLAFMGKLKQQAAELSIQTGKTQTNIAAMYEEMGAAGLAADKWGSYADKFIKGAVALDMEVSELSQKALGIAAATGHKDDDKWMQALLEKANLSSDMGKMRAANVLEVANRGMGVAKASGIDENAFIALSGAALDAGGQDEVIGRAWKTIATRLTTTVKLTKKQKKAWESLNINPETFTQAFRKDPIGKMKELTEAAKKSGDAMGSIGVIVGMDFADTVLKMGDNIGTAENIYKSLADEQLRSSKFLGEYNRMQQTTAANIARSSATLRYFGNMLGSLLLPK